MKIAYVSYEYPPDTATGGIATYVHQAAQLMRKRGHMVEVFCASFSRSVSEEDNGILIHRIKCEDRSMFSELILPVFIDRQSKVDFNVIESPEFSGDGLAISKAYPNLPLVVKLHTPWFLINQMNNSYLTFSWKLKYLLYWLYKEYRLRERFWVYNRESDPDYILTKRAHLITTPSIDLGHIVAAKWDIPRDKIINLPYPFIPNPALLEVPVETNKAVITFIGRLEIRKGILDLCQAIPIVLQQYPRVIFRFVGKSDPSPVSGLNMEAYIRGKYAPYLQNIEFLGKVNSQQIPNILAQTDICVFPSIWENFPNVCLEAMSAGRAVIGSNAGGMREMLADSAGLLVAPGNPLEIAHGIIKLLNDNNLRYLLGHKARERVLNSYNAEVIGKSMEHCYRKVIDNVSGTRS
jgi:glycogen synthase